MARPTLCPLCGGSGAGDDDGACERCAGTGMLHREGGTETPWRPIMPAVVPPPRIASPLWISDEDADNDRADMAALMPGRL